MLRSLLTFGRRPAVQERARVNRFRPQAELLECREVPAHLVWTAAGDGTLWSDADNWEVFDNGQLSGTHQTPAAGDTLWFGALGGGNASSVVDLNFTVGTIIQNNTYTGNLIVSGSLDVTGSISAYGHIIADGRVEAEEIFLTGGAIEVGAVGPTERMVVGLVSMTNGATLTVDNPNATTLTIDNLTMAVGTTFEMVGSGEVVLNGSIGTSGTVEIVSTSLFVTGTYNQPTGTLLLTDCFLWVESTAPTSLSGHTVAVGAVTITAATVQIDGPGLFEYSSTEEAQELTIGGDFEVRSGTFRFNDILGMAFILEDFSVFIGTLVMNVGEGTATQPQFASNQFLVGGTASIGASVGGATLSLNPVGTFPSPTEFILIFAGFGSGDFFNMSGSVSAHGWTGGIYKVTL